MNSINRERTRISLIQLIMTTIIFRNLPRVSTIERQLDLNFRDRLLDDEIDELPHLTDDVSLALFGITQRDTFYWALPVSVRAKYGRSEWEENFDILSQRSRDPNAHWGAFGLDLRCSDGVPLRCIEVFGRQLVCALNSLHPEARLAFKDAKTLKAAA